MKNVCSLSSPFLQTSAWLLLLCMSSLFVQAQTAYIVNNLSNDLSVIDVATMTVTTTIPIGPDKIAVAVSEDGQKVYVIPFTGSHEVLAIDPITNTVTDTIIISGGGVGGVMNPAGTKLYVSNEDSSTLTVINTATNVVEATIPMGLQPTGLAVSPDGSELYAALAGSDEVRVVDLSNNVVVDTLQVGGFPRWVSFSPDGISAYVSNTTTGDLSVINTNTRLVEYTVDLQLGPGTSVPTLDGATLFVNNQSSNTISVIDLTIGFVTNTIVVGASPAGLDITPDGTQLFVVNYFSNNVMVIDIATETIIDTIAVGNGPFSIGNFLSGYQEPLEPATSLAFDGVDDHVVLPDSFASNFSAGTISGTAWCYLDEEDTWGTIIKNWGDTNWGAFHFGIEIDSAVLSIEIQDGSGRLFAISPDTFPLNQWVHAAFTADGDSVRLYQDGVQQAAVAYDGTLFTDFPATYIGAKPNDDGNGVDLLNPGYWNGRLDEISLWDRALTPAELQQVASCQPAAGTPGLLAYYNFDQGFLAANNGTDTVLTDQVSGMYRGVLTNFALTGTESNWADGNVLAVCAPTVSIEEFFATETGITLVPNPATDLLMVQIEGKQTTDARLSIFDLSGRMVQSRNELLEQGPQSLVVDVRQLSSGFYFLVMEVGNDRYAEKFIKQD